MVTLCFAESTKTKIVLGLAEFNGDATPDALMPTHSSGALEEPGFGAKGQGDADKAWRKEGATGPSLDSGNTTTHEEGSGAGRAQEDSDWRSSRVVPASPSEPDPANNWRGTESGAADKSGWKRDGPTSATSGVGSSEKEGNIILQGAEKGRSNGVSDWRSSAQVTNSSLAIDPASGRQFPAANWRGTASGAADKSDWKREGPTSRPAAAEIAGGENAQAQPWRGSRGAPERSEWKREGPTSSREMKSAVLVTGSDWRSERHPTSPLDQHARRSQAPATPRACMFFAQGRCQRGDKCQFSHDQKIIGAFLQMQDDMKVRRKEDDLKANVAPRVLRKLSPATQPEVLSEAPKRAGASEVS
jgi:hypothetical protein